MVDTFNAYVARLFIHITREQMTKKIDYFSRIQVLAWWDITALLYRIHRANITPLLTLQ